MKRLILITALLLIFNGFSQTKKNGTIYMEHPAIDAVENMVKAFVEGDAEKVASYLHDDFQVVYGLNSNRDAEPGDKESFVNSVKFWHENVDYYSMKRQNGAYPDALEYKDDNQRDVVWVQTWDRMQGVHKESGVKLDMPVHRLYVVDKDNKILRLVNYLNQGDYEDIRNSYSVRTNGTIYDQHTNINTVRKVIRAWEFNDLDKGYAHYHEDARFRSVHLPPGEPGLTLEEDRKSFEDFLENYTINRIDEVGYPDYLDYDVGDAKVVMSWWRYTVTRKSDNKRIQLPVHYSHRFDDEGKITSENIYYSRYLLEQE